MNIAQFLLARIADDEAAAEVANTGAHWESWNRSWDPELRRDIASGGVRLFAVPLRYDEYIARNDPARVLAECEAKRRIVGLLTGAGDRRDEWESDGANTAYDACMILAAIYSDHPDYDQAWKISA